MVIFIFDHHQEPEGAEHQQPSASFGKTRFL
jgi:hypothetical protein